MAEHVFMFLIGSSVCISIFPLVYLAQAYDTFTEDCKSRLRVSVPMICLAIPILLGVLFAILYPLLRDFGVPRKVSGIYVRFSMAGAVAAGIISVILDQVLGLYAVDCLDVESPMLTHAVVAAAYFCIFQVIGVWLYKRVACVFDEPAPKPTLPAFQLPSTPSASPPYPISPSLPPSIPPSLPFPSSPTLPPTSLGTDPNIAKYEKLAEIAKST